jgi:hypothetical protein
MTSDCSVYSEYGKWVILDLVSGCARTGGDRVIGKDDCRRMSRGAPICEGTVCQLCYGLVLLGAVGILTRPDASESGYAAITRIGSHFYYLSVGLYIVPELFGS